jgi:penicillin G amidase
VQDFYVECLDDKRSRYRVKEDWLPLQVDHYQIPIRGRSQAAEFDVKRTRHGPVLNAEDWRDLVPETGPSGRLKEYVLALEWEALTIGESAGAFEELGYAATWNDFVGAVRRFSAPSQNFVYADVDGNIGYAMSGLLPQRSRGIGAMPMIGWTDDAEWKGEIDTATLPVAFNPPRGQIVTANNEVDRNLPYVITVDWVAPFRAQRIEQLLADRRGLGPAEMMAIQTDVTSASADAVLRALGASVPEELRQWDRKVDARPVSTFYEAFEAALWRRTFADEMPQALYDRFYRYAANERVAGLHAVIGDPNSTWFDDRTTPGVRETRDDVVRLAAQDARTLLQAMFPREADRNWDRLHALKFAHPLSGGGRVLDWFFSRGPVPLAGDGMTVNKTATNLRRPYGTSDAASYRQILDVGSWDQSLAVNTTGQSGHPASPHYFDQNALWRTGGYRPLPFSRPAVEAATVSRLELFPDERQ